IGALLGPLYTRYLMDYGFEWRIVFKYLGFAGTVVLVLFIFAVKKGGRTEDIEHKQKSGIDFSFFLSEKKVWVMFMILFLYVGHQSGINIWLPMYMEESMGVSPRLGSMSLSIFWTAIITGRFLVAKFGSRLKNSNIIRWGSIAGAIILTAGIVAGHPVTTTITTGIAGLLTGAFIPLVVDTASGEYPEYMGMVTSILFLAINLSMMFFPWLVGLIAQNLSFQMGMMVTSLVLVGTFFLSFNIE
ncbi:MAG: MFS transporter, partial [Halanaerobiales bacterium]